MTKRKICQIGELTSSLFDPMMRKKVGFNVALLANWPQIVGEEIADSCAPKKILWRRVHRHNDVFEPSVLIVACDGFAAMRLTHQTSEVIERINSFFGYRAVGKLRIEQTVLESPRSNKPAFRPEISAEIKQKIARLTSVIDDNELQACLAELGQHIFSREEKRE